MVSCVSKISAAYVLQSIKERERDGEREREYDERGKRHKLMN